MTAPQSATQQSATQHPAVPFVAHHAPVKPPSKPRRERNHWLDAVRGIAVIRVVLWHAFASAFLSWTVTTMPAMFFVAGSLLAYSLDKRPFDQLLAKRMKRLLIPYWTLGAALLVVLAFVHRTQGSATTDMSIGQFIAWLVPIVDPKGSAWEAGWVATPLWYLRCYLWLLVLSPLYRRAQRRWGTLVLLVPVVGIFVVDFLIRHPEFAPDVFTQFKWYAGDLVTYSFFLILGFSHHDGLANKLTRRDRIEWTGIGLAAGLLWIAAVDVPGNVVNNSYPMLFFIGIAWLGFFLTFEPEIAKLQTMRFTAPIMGWIGRRAMTVYLWHTTAIVFAYWVLARFAPDANRVMIIPIIIVATMALSALFGWIEDVSAGQAAEWWPGRPMPHIWNRLSPENRRAYTGVIGGLAVGVIGLAFLLGPTTSGPAQQVDVADSTETAGLNLPPAPSAKPAEVEFAEAPSAPAPVAGGTQGALPTALAFADGDAAAIRERVQVAIDAWRTEQAIAGMYLGVSLPDQTQLLFTSGVGRDGETIAVTDDFAITSVTKTMTSALIMSLVDDGRIDLDDTIPDLAAYPDYRFADQVTYRQLLMHTSGITTYKETVAYQEQGWWERNVSVSDALDLSTTQDLAWTPGTDVGYSSTGYITLGLLAGQLLGGDYEQVLQDRIFDVADMPDSYLDTTPFAGWVGFSSGGVRSTLHDMLNWGSALYRERTVISNDSVEEVIDLDNPWSAGLGSYPVCPCWLDDDGNKVVASIGHNGGEATIQWSHEDDLVIAAGVTESWTNETTQSHIVQLLLDVRTAVAGS